MRHHLIRSCAGPEAQIITWSRVCRVCRVSYRSNVSTKKRFLYVSRGKVEPKQFNPDHCYRRTLWTYGFCLVPLTSQSCSLISAMPWQMAIAALKWHPEVSRASINSALLALKWDAKVPGLVLTVRYSH